jgi:chemotaxis protein methyltransferase CheR
MDVPEITNDQFAWLRSCVRKSTGIHLSDSKRQLLVARLAPRLRHHGFPSFSDYIWFLAGEHGAAELRELVNSITTNKTSFFRESHHFELLATYVTAHIAERSRRGEAKRVRIWSAGCSTGEEVYSAAMVVRAALRGIAWDIRLVATDIDTDVLAEASAGVYDESRVEDIPAVLRDKWLECGADGTFRVCAEIRDLIDFRHLNFIVQPWPLRGPFDAIFCRNVAIYFDGPTQHRLYRGLAERLVPGGYLFIGHSETARDLGDLLEPAGPTTYRRRAGPPRASMLPRSSTHPPSRSQRAARRSVRLPSPGAARPSVRSPLRSSGDHVIHAGGVFVSKDGARVRTLVGSCVAVCMCDPISGIGGMNHFMLPHGDRAENPARFGAAAMELLIDGLLQNGAERDRLRAKVFGASHVLAGTYQDIPGINIAFIREYLHTAQIPILAEKLGADRALQIAFETDTGRAFVRELPPSDAPIVVGEDLRYVRQITQDPSLSSKGTASS